MDAIEFARSLRKTSTPAERTVWRWLRRRHLKYLKFRRQHPVGPYVLDFFCPELHLCIELDGEVHSYRYAKDVARTEFLEGLGISVLRLSNDYVRRDPDGAWECIVAKVEEMGAPHPSPLPARRGEGEP